MWERAPTFCGVQSFSSRALHSAARGGRTAAPTPRSVVFGGRVVRDHAEVSARAAVGAQPPHNQHLHQRAKRAPAKQQQCCAPQSRSVPARGGAAFPPTCGPLPAPRASADSARERSSPTYCPLRWWWICGWQHHATECGRPHFGARDLSDLTTNSGSGTVYIAAQKCLLDFIIFF